MLQTFILWSSVRLSYCFTDFLLPFCAASFQFSVIQMDPFINKEVE